MESLVHIGRPFLFGCLLQQFVFLGRRLTVSHLSLHVLDLLLEEVVALLLVDVLTGLVADIGLQVLKVNLTVDHLHHTEQTLFHCLLQQQLHLLIGREGHVRADEVEGHDIVTDILDGKRGLVGNIVRYVNVLVDHVPQVFHRGLELPVALLRLNIVERINFTLEIGRGRENTFQVHTTETLHDGGNVTIGQCQLFHHLRIDTKFIKVFLLRIVHVGIALGNDTDDGTALLGLLYEGLARFATDQDGRYHTWEKDDIPDG